MLALATVLCAGGGGRASPARAARAAPAADSQAARPAPAADYVPGQVIVGYAPAPGPGRLAHATRRTAAADDATPRSRVVRVPPGDSIWAAIASLRRRHGVL